METQNFNFAVAVTALILTGNTSRAAEPAALTVVLHMTDMAKTDEGDFGRARAEAQRIFEDAHVRLAWVDIGLGPAARACEGTNLFVSLLSAYQVQQRIAQGMKASVLGSASPSAGSAFIHSPQIHELAPRRRIDEGVLLGRVIAHEVGHLLLGGQGHSRTGLMTAGMETDPIGLQVFFTSKEARAVRARIESKGLGSGPQGRADCGESRAAGAR